MTHQCYDTTRNKMIQTIVYQSSSKKRKIGVIVSFILFGRLFYYLYRIMLPMNVSNTDPITSFLMICMGYNIVSSDQYYLYAQMISLLFSLGLIVSQIRSFVFIVRLMVKRFFSFYVCTIICKNRVHDDHASIRSDTMHQLSDDVLCTCMGSYFLSCVMVLKVSLPNTYSNIFFSSFSMNAMVQLNVYSIRSIFILSSCVTIGLLFIIHRIQVSNSNVRSRYTNHRLHLSQDDSV